MAGLFDFLSSGGKGMSDSAAQGLLATGLGILANNRGLTSGSQAIGLGGLQGLQTYQNAQVAELKNAQLSQLKLQQQIAKQLLGGGANTGAAQPQSNAYIPPAGALGSGTFDPNAATPSAPTNQYLGGATPQAQIGPGISQPSPAANAYLGGATPQATPQTGQQGGGMFAPNNLQSIAALHMVGGPNLMDAFKYANTPQQIAPGYVKDPNTGQMSYLPDPVKGVNYDMATGKIKPIDGYMDLTAGENLAKKGMIKMKDGSWAYAPGVVGAEARMAGSTAGAKAGAEANYKFQTIAGPDGKEMAVTDAHLAQRLRGGFGGGGGATSGAPMQIPAPQGYPSIVKRDPRAENMAHFGGRGAANSASEIFKNATESTSSANAAIEDVDHLIRLSKSPGTMGRALSYVKPGVAEFLSPEAAEYGKRRANLIAQSGAAFGANTDAARSNIEKMIPAYGLPNQAQIAGLDSLKNQLMQKKLIGDVLSRHYNAGNEQGVIAADTALKTHLSPEMMPHLSEVLQPSSAQGRSAAVQELMKSQSGAQVLQLLHDSGMLQ